MVGKKRKQAFMRTSAIVIKIPEASGPLLLELNTKIKKSKLSLKNLQHHANTAISWTSMELLPAQEHVILMVFKWEELFGWDQW
jgi:hypothetical protein